VSGDLAAEITLPDGATLLTGEGVERLGQLEGRSGTLSSTTWWGHDPGTPDLTAVEWMVQAPAGSVAAVTARHPRAGTARAEIRLG
jgi:hypothetical protein